MQTRRARLADAEEICVVVRRSITELCVADHRNDPSILGAWLGNKLPEHVRGWIAANPDGVFVADDGKGPCGVAIVLPSGEVVLNYVSPEARFKGTSKALMTCLEARARDLGLDRITLVSTATAHRFYRGLGYADLGETVSVGSMPAFKMEKRLEPA